MAAAINKAITFPKYLLSDKRAMPYWIGLFILTILFSAVGWIATITSGIINITSYLKLLLYPTIICIIFIGFYTSNYLNYQKQQQFKLLIEDKLKLGKFAMVTIYVFQENFTTTPMKSNYSASIKIDPWKGNFEYIKLDDAIIILAYVFEMGLLRRHIKPMIVCKRDETVKTYRNVIYPEVKELTQKDGTTRILFHKSIEGIKQLSIKIEA